MGDDRDDGNNKQPEEAGVQRQRRHICTVIIPEWDCLHDDLAIFQHI